MKTARKVLLLVLCAALLVSATVMGTMAYLTSQTEAVKNTFTVGKVTITLDEAPVDANGKATEGARVLENEYHLLPGGSYDKDPTVHVAEGSEDCYLFVKVENGIAAIEGDTTIAAQLAANGWTLVEGNVYIYNEVASAGDDVAVFKTITVDGDVDNDTLADYADAEVTVTAYAIQKQGFENSTAAEIWAAVGA